jgi:hypothetical protein
MNQIPEIPVVPCNLSLIFGGLIICPLRVSLSGGRILV